MNYFELIAISVITYVIVQHFYEKQKNDRRNEAESRFAAKYGDVDNTDPDALNAYYEAMEREIGK